MNGRIFPLTGLLFVCYGICMVDHIEKKPKKTWTHRADNRARLIAAGYDIIGEKGVEAATVKEIADRAGVSPGLFHYHLKSKDELLLAVLYEAGRRFRDRIVAGAQAAQPEQSSSAAMMIAHMVGRQDPTWHRLRYELFALGLRKPDFLPEVGKFLAKARQGITQTVVQFTGMEEERAKVIAEVLLACSDGLALQQLAQPDLDLSGAYDVMKALLAGEFPAER